MEDDSRDDDPNELEPFSDPRRRSPRVSRRVELVARSGRTVAALESVIVNENGGLVVSPTRFEAGATLQLRNELLGKDAEAWVIWVGPSGKPGIFDLGIELAVPDAGFWGVRGKALPKS